MPHLLFRRVAAAGAGLAAAAALTVTASPADAAGAGAYTTTTHQISAAAGWLATQFEGRTGLPRPGGDHFDYGSGFGPNYGENADVIFGLAASGSARTKIARALGYLVRHADAYADFSDSTGYGPADGAIAKMALAAIVAGANPQQFGGHHLLTRLRRDECREANAHCVARGAGRNIFSSISESFVILAEGRGPARFAPSVAARRYLLSLQCRSGGFTAGTSTCHDGKADVDATAYAIMALDAAGMTAAPEHAAVKWLLRQRRSGQYWMAQGGPDVNSTGLALAALSGRGIDLAGSRRWLLAQQVPARHAGAGALRYAGSFAPTTRSATSPSVLATAQALTGLVRGGSLATVSAAGAGRTIAMFAPGAWLSTGRAAAGAPVTATGRGFVAGETVHVVLDHQPRHPLGSSHAGPAGIVRVAFRAPHNAPGRHDITLVGSTSGFRVTRTLVVSGR